jgi:hypothetical protein
MAIKIIQRAAVDPKFMECVLNIYRAFMMREKERAAEYPAGAKEYIKKRAPAHARILAITTVGHSQGRVGAEYELTRLRVLPYEKFMTVAHKGADGKLKKYLVGVTKPVVIKDNGKTYFLGPYAIYVPADAFDAQNSGSFHFIPTKFPQSNLRHPHHVVKNNPQGMHPLDKHASTCWGGFGPAIRVLLDIPDIPELFRLLQMYVSRYDAGSVLSFIRNLDFPTTEEA